MSGYPKDRQQNYQELFQTYLIETFTLIKKIHPDSKRLAQVIQKFRKTERTTYIQYTLNNLSPHIQLICSEDESLFSDDYSPKPLFLLVGLDFKPMWKSQSPIDKTISSDIFTHLQLLFIYGSLHLKLNKSLVRDLIENLKVNQDLESDIQAAEEKEKADAEMGGIASIFGKNNPIFELLTEVAQDPELLDKLSLPSDRSSTDPTELLTKLFSADNLGNIMNIFQTKLQEKMVEKNMTPEDWEKETSKLNEKMMKKMKNNPLFKSLGLDKMISKMTESMKQPSNESGEGTDQHLDHEQIGSIAAHIQDFLGSLKNDPNMKSTFDMTKMADMINNLSAGTQPSVETEQEVDEKLEIFAAEIEAEFARLKRPQN